MIKVTRLNGKEYYLNADLIEIVEETPDTVITLRDGKKLVVCESVDEVIKRILKYKQDIFCKLPDLYRKVE